MGRAIVIVTGANSGVGYATCQRLLLQLSQPCPPDMLPQPHVSPSSASTSLSTTLSSPFDALTIILACRSPQRGLAARDQLLVDFDIEVLRKRVRAGGKSKDSPAVREAEHAERFRRELVLDFVQCDLASAASVLEFAGNIQSKYPYISHIFCNAGVGAFSGIDWPVCYYQLFTEPIVAVTFPIYKKQHTGVMSSDGLGWVWQCNVFGHYLLVRNLKSLLSKSPSTPARVMWTSSLDTQPARFSLDDWQLTRTAHSYELSKFETELIANRLNAAYRGSKGTREGDEEGTAVNENIRHFIVHPGVTATSVYSIIGPILDWCMKLAFYIARWLGSTRHNISPLNGAHSASHIALAPLEYLPPVPSSSPSSSDSAATSPTLTGSSTPSLPNTPPPSSSSYTATSPNPSKATSPSGAVVFGSHSDRLGRSWVVAEPCQGYDDEGMEGVADELIARCDRLCEEFEGRVRGKGVTSA